MIKEAQHRWRAALRLLGKYRAAEGESPCQGDREPPIAYQPRGSVLEGVDWLFYQRLQRALGGSALVFPKLSACDVVRVASAAKHLDQAVRIDRKRVDFVICDRGSSAPRLAILIEHWHQERGEYAPRDHHLERAILAAGVTLIRVRSDRLPSVGQIREKFGSMFLPAEDLHSAWPVSRAGESDAGPARRPR